MLLRWLRRKDPIEREWQQLAASLSLTAAPESGQLLAELLDLPDPSDMGPVYRVSETGELDVWVFSHRGQIDPRTRSKLTVTACLLTSDSPFSSTSWRASPRMHEVLASLQASASGGQILRFDGEDGGEAELTVVARDVAAAREQLGPRVRTVLERAVNRLDQPIGVTVGGQRILLSTAGESVRFDAVEYLLSDVMSIYAALRGR